MDSGQSPAARNADQEIESKALPGEETSSTLEYKEQSKLAQVCTVSGIWLPELQHIILKWSLCSTLEVLEQKRSPQNLSQVKHKLLHGCRLCKMASAAQRKRWSTASSMGSPLTLWTPDQLQTCSMRLAMEI